MHFLAGLSGTIPYRWPGRWPPTVAAKKTQSNPPLIRLTLKVRSLLHRLKISYLVIGGMAVGVVGEPRFTQDLDIDLFLREVDIPSFLKAAKKASFAFSNRRILSSVRLTGAFSIREKDTHVDFIIASTPFEEEALKRRQRLKLFGVFMPFPSPEDMILLKIIPGRTSDLADAESIVSRHRAKLDKAYLERWARRLSEDQENPRIWGTLRKLMS